MVANDDVLPKDHERDRTVAGGPDEVRFVRQRSDEQQQTKGTMQVSILAGRRALRRLVSYDRRRARGREDPAQQRSTRPVRAEVFVLRPCSTPGRPPL